MRTLLRYIGRTGYPAISLYAVFLFHICSAQVQPRRYPRLGLPIRVVFQVSLLFELFVPNNQGEEVRPTTYSLSSLLA
jgi:hypothetical protein